MSTDSKAWPRIYFFGCAAFISALVPIKKKSIWIVLLFVVLIFGCNSLHSYADGEVYFCEYQPGKFSVAKIVDVKPTKIFVCMYRQSFDGAPQNLDLTLFDECPNNTGDAGDPENRGKPVSYPIAIKYDEFSMMHPQLLKNIGVTDGEKKMATDFWRRYPEEQ